MTAHSKWNAQPLNMTMNQEIIDHMIAAVDQIITHGNAVGLRAKPVHLLVKEKEFKYGKGKEYIAFTDGGPNQFGKDVKYVKFFYDYGNTAKLKPNDKTYTFGLEKARTFWNNKVNEGYNTVENSTIYIDDETDSVGQDVTKIRPASMMSVNPNEIP